MNKTFSQGYKIITSYRNSKLDNWISRLFSLVLRESKFLNHSRMPPVWAVPFRERDFYTQEVIENGGWKFFCWLRTSNSPFTVSSPGADCLLQEGDTLWWAPTDFAIMAAALGKKAFCRFSNTAARLRNRYLPISWVTTCWWSSSGPFTDFLSAVCNVTAIIIGTILVMTLRRGLFGSTCINGYPLLPSDSSRWYLSGSRSIADLYKIVIYSPSCLWVYLYPIDLRRLSGRSSGNRLSTRKSKHWRMSAVKSEKQAEVPEIWGIVVQNHVWYTA